MLHEILLSLSGHPSPLFDPKDSSATDRSIDFPLLSPPEQALLQSIGRLSHLHRNLRDHATQLSSSHPSTIARAVATAISTVHLARFQKKILEVEVKILRRDAGVVGAYNIVPLAGVVGEFDEWRRRLEWYWELVCFIRPLKPAAKDASASCSGAALIDKLRQEAQTGYVDIEEAALRLGKVAEMAWLRQLSGWVLYGRLPLAGAQDFFVQAMASEEGKDMEYEIAGPLLPRFVSRETASSILFIGKSLNVIRIRGKPKENRIESISELDLVPVHLAHLSKLAFPLSAASLSAAIIEIRSSLSRNTLQQLLPLASILQVLSVFRDFFLLKRGDFAVALIDEADACLRARNRSSKAPDSLRGLLIKEAELTSILNKTFATLSYNTEDDADTVLDFARSQLQLHTAKPTSTRPSTPGRARATENLPQLSPVLFNDLLLPIPTSLTMNIKPPFDLFLTAAEVNIYSSIQAYILSIRRAHLRLSSLWRQTQLRRRYPTAPLGNRPNVTKQLIMKRERAGRRNEGMRAMWATTSAAVFLLGEIGNYFEGEVIDEAWEHCQSWMRQTPRSRPGSSRSRPQSSRSEDNAALQAAHRCGKDLASRLQDIQLDSQPQTETPAPHDPALLTTAHRAFLTSLCHAIFLTNISLTTQLRNLFRDIDHLVALVLRLQSIQESLDLEEDEGVVDPMGDFTKQEGEVKRDLGRARKKVDSGCRGVLEELRKVDQEGIVDQEDGDGEEGAFVPYRGAGVERLLMRLEGGRRTNDGNEDADMDD